MAANRMMNLASLPRKVQNDDALHTQAERYALQGHEVYNQAESELNPEADALYQQSMDCLSSIKNKTYRTYFLMGTTSEWLRKYEDALQYLDRSLDDPLNKEYRQQATYWKAVTLWEGFERKDEALRLFWECLKQENDIAWKFNILDWIMRVYIAEPTDDDGIRKWLATVSQLLPTATNLQLPVHLYVIQLKKNGGNLALIPQLVDLGLSLAPDDTHLLIEKTEYLSERGDKEEAKATLKKIEARSDELSLHVAKKIERLKSKL